MTAAEMTTQVIDVLTLKGYTVWRNNSGRVRHNVRLSPTGTPDIIGYSPDGAFVGVEVKAPGDRLSDGQREWIERADRCGCYVMVVYSMDEVDKIVEKWR